MRSLDTASAEWLGPRYSASWTLETFIILNLEGSSFRTVGKLKLADSHSLVKCLAHKRC